MWPAWDYLFVPDSMGIISCMFQQQAPEDATYGENSELNMRYFRSMSLKLIPIESDFLLVVNSNLGHRFYCFRDIATENSRNHNFYPPQGH